MKEPKLELLSMGYGVDVLHDGTFTLEAGVIVHIAIDSRVMYGIESHTGKVRFYYEDQIFSNSDEALQHLRSL